MGPLDCLEEQGFITYLDKTSKRKDKKYRPLRLTKSE